jgi:broad specificity phosphatase PhoE
VALRALRRLLGRGVPWDFPERRPGERHLVLVRHGEAAAGFGQDPDPGLSERGRAQAEAAAADLAPLGPLPVVVSPLRRCRETAAALEARWGAPARVDPAVGEIVAPASAAGLAARAEWVRTALGGRWADLDEEHRLWRAAVLGALRSLPGDAVVVTHFVAINVAVGEALGNDRVVSFAPANGSRTFLRVAADGALGVVKLGEAGTAQVL